MITNRDFIETILESLRSDNIDQFFSRKFIFNVANQYARTYIAQRLSVGRGQRNPFIFTTLKCFEVKDVDDVDLGGMSAILCDNLKVSKETLPDIITSSNFSGIKNITTLDNKKRFQLVDYTKAMNMSNVPNFGKINKSYAFVRDGRLYLTNTRVSRVKLDVLTLDVFEAKKKDVCYNMGCKSKLDYQFPIQDSLFLNFVAGVKNELVSIYKRIPEDEILTHSKNEV